MNIRKHRIWFPFKCGRSESGRQRNCYMQWVSLIMDSRMEFHRYRQFDTVVVINVNSTYSRKLEFGNFRFQLRSLRKH